MSDAMPARPVVREVSDHDADALAAIYNHYVRETIVTFEEEPITAAVMLTRVNAVRMAQLQTPQPAGHGVLRSPPS